MNTEKVASYFEALIPLAAFLMIFGLFAWVLVLAQRRDGFDAADFLRDDSGKLSKGGLFAFIACATHTWVIMVQTINARETEWQVAIYALTWSGSLLLLEAIKAWKGKT